MRLAALSFLLLLQPVARAAEAPARASEFLTPGTVWPVHITVSSEEWKAIEPKHRPGARPGAPPPEKAPAKEGDRPTTVSPFGIEYPYVHADVEIAGRTLKNVGLRFKGNASYVAARGLKKPFKLDFNRWDSEQSFLGLEMLNFSNNAMDPSSVRETVSYATFRAGGVPAPRTAHARVTLTVPGVHDNALMGLYTIVECVDKPFLKDHFGSAKGMLLKPEGIQGLPYYGEDWTAYKGRYLPKKEPAMAESRRLIEFVKLVNKADDAEFARRIADYIDVDEFLRYAAANSALTNLDSFFGIGHNYYMYLHPKTDRFVWIPWDLDHSLGGFGMFGSPEQMMDWSIRKPYHGENKLTQRLVAIPANEAKFRDYLKALVEGPFRPAPMNALIDSVQAAIQPTIDDEAKVQAGGLFGFGFGRMMTKPPDVKTFIDKRVTSIGDQLAGKSKGQEIRSMGGDRRLAPPLADSLIKAADRDKSGNLSLDELEAAIREWVREPLDVKTIVAAIEKAVPPPAGRGGFGQSPIRDLATAVVRKSGSDAGKSVDADALISALRESFKEWDKNDDGRLDRDELIRVISELPRR